MRTDTPAYFMDILKHAEKTYGSSSKRLAGEGWPHAWQVLITTILSAQSRDETTIPIAESLFFRYPTLESLSRARYTDVFALLKSINYNRTKAKHVIAAAQALVERFSGRTPDTIEELVTIPGVGRKTANLVITEVHQKPGITVDTHVHRICNVLGLVRTTSPHGTEKALRARVPRPYWSRINRLFVLWGKDCPGRDKQRLLQKIGMA